MRSFWYGAMIRLRPEGAERGIGRTFSAEQTFGHFQTFHVWLGSFGGFAAHPVLTHPLYAGVLVYAWVLAQRRPDLAETDFG